MVSVLYTVEGHVQSLYRTKFLRSLVLTWLFWGSRKWSKTKIILLVSYEMCDCSCWSNAEETFLSIFYPWTKAYECVRENRQPGKSQALTFDLEIYFRDRHLQDAAFQHGKCHIYSGLFQTLSWGPAVGLAWRCALVVVGEPWFVASAHFLVQIFLPRSTSNAAFDSCLTQGLGLTGHRSTPLLARNIVIPWFLCI
jgi:hypothetical protein